MSLLLSYLPTQALQHSSGRCVGVHRSASRGLFLLWAPFAQEKGVQDEVIVAVRVHMRMNC